MAERYHKVGVLLWLMMCVIAHAGQGQYKYPFQNPDLSAEERIDNALSLMTLEEKAACLGTDPTVERLGIRGTSHMEGLHGLAVGGPGKWGRDHPVTTTTFPQAYGLAESWDPGLIKTVAEIESEEARFIFQNKNYERGGLVIRAPNADLGRDPRWGRTEECYGEDAWFNAKMTVAFAKGLQGDHPKYWKTASLMKHFMANSNEDGRDSSSSDFGERLFREYYSYPFYKGIKEGGSRAFMAAYNAYYGIPMAVHPMLKAIAIQEWGQDGIICTDGGAFQMLENSHHYYPDLENAAAGTLKAGINQYLDDYQKGVEGALQKGYIKEADIDEALRGVFRVMIKLGMWDPQEMVPYAQIGAKQNEEPWLKEDHKKAVRTVTERTIVLLKNEENTLPLKKEELKSIAVLGSVGQDVFLDWYSGTPPYTISAFDGIKNYLKDNVNVLKADSNDIASQVELAQKSDLALLVVGNHPYCNDPSWKVCDTPSFGREAVDRRSLSLEEEELIKKVYEVNPNTVVVLVSSFPYAINWTQENIPAIIHMTHNSQEMGNALANVLFGEVNPAGRLVQTWPKSLDQLPPMMDYDITNGRTYMYSKKEPLYPFGYGLSYSSFSYHNLAVDQKSIPVEGELSIELDVTNTGSIDGDEVVQLYVKHINSSVERPIKELKGFGRVYIPAGETRKVVIPLKAQDLAYWDEQKKDFVVEKDKIKVMIGSSSQDIRLEKEIRVR
ncbi:glycoside hydrolase family 3 C-terminal domain-containing protein [Fulvivirga maritima]|uniref:glycoside hydrolase family 3 C-terminal domain-containing protein n=1 Tax=Fulvivirga maritima TaxID=2904247 RepID=UPI001F32714F|nr:glycoside hydrolase family 3 C-terminal domain-containing protein [Fulvivirga maritima]UII24608.1 glycoside hydrolase family 3 C-terminal domain-containing protein [Fulvivirga maritima]